MVSEPTNSRLTLVLHDELQFSFGLEKGMSLKVGDPAPEFELPAVAGENKITIRSRDYLGTRNLVVTFHPLGWTPT